MGNDCAKLAFCSDKYPCSTRNVVCCPFCWGTAGCCSKCLLETYEQQNASALRKRAKEAPTGVQMTTDPAPAAPQLVYVVTTPGQPPA
jgi:hypothetical protein